MNKYQEFRLIEYVRFRCHKNLRQEALVHHKKTNIWHQIGDFCFYAKPSTETFSIKNALIVYNNQCVYDLNKKREVVELYISPIIRHMSKKLWPQRHDLVNKISSNQISQHKASSYVVSWTDDINNYYHALFDLCPKLEWITKNMPKEFPESIIIIGKGVTLPVKLIKLLYPNLFDKIAIIDSKAIIIKNANFILTPQPSYMCSNSVQELAKRIRSTIPSVAKKSLKRKIYAKRGIGKNKRYITNEEHLASILKEEFNFIIIEPGKMSIKEQFETFSEASVLISPHGAGLSNILSTKERTTVIEILPKSFQSSTFAFISASLNLKYERFVYDDTNDNIDIKTFIDYLNGFSEVTAN